MNAHAKTIEPAAETSAIALIEANPVIAFTSPEKFDAFYDKVAAEVRDHVPDLTTEKGRKAIASLAYKIARSKTALDDAGKTLTEDKRAEIKKVDEARKVIRDKLDALKDEARKPLTEWEAAEEERVAGVKRTIQRLQDAAIVSIDDSVDTVKDRLDTLAGVEITTEVFQEYEAAARAQMNTAVTTLTAAVERLTKEAAERAELDRLRRAEADRLAKEEADRVAAEAKAKEEADAKARADREAEEKRLAEERVAAAAQKAAADAAAQAEAKAREEQEARDKAHADQLAAEKRRADEAEAAQKAEANRIAAEKAEADRQAAAQRKADEKRAADREHRGKVMGVAKAAIMAAGGVGEEAAKKIVLAIGAGEVPAVSITY